MHTEPTPTADAPAFAPRTPPAFRELYEKYFAFTWRSLRYLGVPDSHLDDAVQDLWIAAYRGLAAFEGRGDIKTWLFGIAVNVQRNLYRSTRRLSAYVPLSDALTSGMADPMLEREGQEAWTLVQQFMASLDELRRTVFVASLLEGMSPAETAEATGLDVPTIYHRVRSLRQSFRAWAAAHRGEQ